MKKGRLQGSNEKLWMNRSSSFSSFHFWSLSTIFGRSGHKRETFVYGIWDFPITAKQHLSANGPVNLAKIVFKILLRSSPKLRASRMLFMRKTNQIQFHLLLLQTLQIILGSNPIILVTTRPKSILHTFNFPCLINVMRYKIRYFG